MGWPWGAVARMTHQMAELEVEVEMSQERWGRAQWCAVAHHAIHHILERLCLLTASFTT